MSRKGQVRMYGITAITHYNGAKAWRVTLYRAGAKQVEREFPFLSHGGELQALAKAQAYRDEQMLLHPPQLSREVRQRLRQTNTSGHAGVSRYRIGKHWYWVAQTKRRDGKPLKKSFRIDRYGEDQAKALAIEERKRQLLLIDHVVLRSAEAQNQYAQLLADERLDTDALRKCPQPPA
ncbi:hypothetical protein ACRYHF_11770 [Stutzerimonas balearica]|uniref:hypothetical protein n=1 Tax=Stutzerimonas balearica TaxID=74829 RepID=UPI003F5AE902